MRARLFLAAVVLCAAPAVRSSVQNPADHPEQYAVTDVIAGAAIYDRTCANCHGVSGTGVGGIDLHRGILPRARTDAALRNVITTGFPQAGMPPFRLSEDELRAIVAYVRTGPAAVAVGVPPAGDAVRGQGVVEGKGSCLSCHRIGAKGAFSAPELTAVGQQQNAASIIWRSLNNPSSSMRPINRPVRAVTRDGKVINGRRLNEDTYTVQLMTDDGRLVGFVKSELRELSVGTTSPMPSFKDKLTPQELADVLGYLVSLKGQ